MQTVDPVEPSVIITAHHGSLRTMRTLLLCTVNAAAVVCHASADEPAAASESAVVRLSQAVLERHAARFSATGNTLTILGVRVYWYFHRLSAA